VRGSLRAFQTQTTHTRLNEHKACLLHGSVEGSSPSLSALKASKCSKTTATVHPRSFILANCFDKPSWGFPTPSIISPLRDVPNQGPFISTNKVDRYFTGINFVNINRYPTFLPNILRGESPTFAKSARATACAGRHWSSSRRSVR